MKKYLFVFSISFFVVAFNSLIAQGTSQEYMMQLGQAEDEFRTYLPKIELLEIKYTNDSEFLIGSAILYERYYTSKSEAEKIDKYWERVLFIDPNNKIALATTLRNNQYWDIQKQSLIFDELNNKIKSAKEGGHDSVKIYYQINFLSGTNNRTKYLPKLYKYFSNGDNKDIVINDFESAEVQLKAKLDVELAESLDNIDNAENRDPNNALYNYLKAHIYFKLGYNDYGLKQLKSASQKEYLKTYYSEINQSVSKVLELIDFPESLRQYIKASYTPAAQFIRESILNEDLEPLIAEYLKQDKDKQIKEILDIVSLIKEQILLEPMPDDTLPKKYGEIVEKWIKKHSEN